MRTVKVSRIALREVVIKNRESHEAEYKAAWAGYHQTCINALEDCLSQLKADPTYVVKFNESPPQSHLDDYARVIAMLSMSVDDVIELSATEFAQYAQDDWAWREDWNVRNTKYITGK